MVPVRFIAETFNITINWDQETNTILINSEKPHKKRIQKISYPMPQKSIDGKSYENSYEGVFPYLDEKFQNSRVVAEKDLKSGKTTPVKELMKDPYYVQMIVCHVDDTIWLVEEKSTTDYSSNYNMVIYNPKTKEIIKKPLIATELIKSENLKNIEKSLDKIRKKLGSDYKILDPSIIGGALAHTEDYVYMHYKMEFVIKSGDKYDSLQSNALARVRKSDLFIDFITEYKTNHILLEELETKYDFLDYYGIDEEYYYLTNDNKEIFRVAHDSYELEKVK